MTKIQFQSRVETINKQALIRVPADASKSLPSRGQTMVKGTINGKAFQTPLEPDGMGSHWLKVDDQMQKQINLHEGDELTVTMEPSKDWPEPELPTDLKSALDKHPKIQPLWDDITPMARWDWLRWINSTKSEATRAHRIEVAFSKLSNGSRRPCCFNRTMCTDPYVSKGGVLIPSI